MFLLIEEGTLHARGAGLAGCQALSAPRAADEARARSVYGALVRRGSGEGAAARGWCDVQTRCGPRRQGARRPGSV